jgi:hypothetical protein
MTSTSKNDMKRDGLNIHWKNGIRSFFDIDGITIEVWGSSWSGREEVRIDGRRVSSLRSLRRSSRHEFHYGGHDYAVEFSCLAFGTGTFRITLYRDGIEVDSDIGSAMGPDLLDADGKLVWSRAWKKMLPIFLVSGLAGMLFGYTVTRLLT